MRRLSVIIPVYKAEAYLRRCLDSILDASLLDYIEIIAVNDGSPDSSLDILREFENHYPCVHVIDKPNGGVSSARNAGLDAATGEYVMFVDADDTIDAEALSRLMDTGYTKYDLIATGMRRISRNGDENPDTPLCNEPLTPVPSGSFVHDNDMLIVGSPCAKLFRRSVIQTNQLRFDTSMALYEDAVFNYNFISHTDTVCLSNEILYNYYVNYSSATAQFRGDDFIRCVNTYISVIPEPLRIRTLAFQTFFALFTIYRGDNRPEHKYKWFKRYMDNYYANGGDDIRKYYTVGFTKIFGIVTSINPHLGHMLMSITFTVERLKKRLRHA